MKTITQLSGTLTEADYREPRGVVTSMHLEPTPGVHVKVMLGAAGLVFQRGDLKAAIPLAQLLIVVGANCPEFLVTTGAKSEVEKTPMQQQVEKILADQIKPATEGKS